MTDEPIDIDELIDDLRSEFVDGKDAKKAIEGLLSQQKIIATMADELVHWHKVDGEEREKLLDRIAELESMIAVHRLAVDVDALKARIAELEAALKPFSDAADDLDEIDDAFLKSDVWGHPVAMNITIGDLRAARAALEKKND